MEYKDYYRIMGVGRDAAQDEIKRAYRKLARKYHPDVSKEPDAEARFKEVAEAYAVLKDTERRAAYDQLGRNWKEGQEFRPSQDQGAGFEFSGTGFGDDASAYSDFFESLFGRGFGAQQGFREARPQARGEDRHARVLIDLEDAYSGATRTITLQSPQVDEANRVTSKSRTLNVKIPKGVRSGQHIRLSGQGSPGFGDGKAGDLYLEIDFRPHPLFRVEGQDVFLDLPVTPWEAALGATVKVPTPAGTVDLSIPKGTRAGRKLRLKGRGIPGKTPGDLYVAPVITLPPADTESATALYERMASEMPYNPRGKLGV